MNQETSLNSESLWIPDGFHFLGFEESKQRRLLLDKVYIFFREKGYEEITLPSFDYTSSFQNFLSKSEFKKVFKARDFSGREISPSVDLTLQVVKGLANFTLEQGSHKVFYTGKTIKDTDKSNADRREVLQAGAEILGHSNINTFKMIFTHINELLELFELPEKTTLVIGNTFVFKFLVEDLQFSKDETLYLSTLFYSKDKTLINEFLEKKKVPENKKNALLKLLFSFDKNEIHSFLKTNFPSLEKFIDEADELFQYSSKLQKIDLCIDYSLISDLEYYTGFVFQGYYPKVTFPIFMGGAYDNLFQKFSNIEKRASGFAFNLDIVEEVNRNAS